MAFMVVVVVLQLTILRYYKLFELRNKTFRKPRVSNFNTRRTNDPDILT